MLNPSDRDVAATPLISGNPVLPIAPEMFEATFEKLLGPITLVIVTTPQVALVMSEPRLSASVPVTVVMTLVIAVLILLALIVSIAFNAVTKLAAILSNDMPLFTSLAISVSKFDAESLGVPPLVVIVETIALARSAAVK